MTALAIGLGVGLLVALAALWWQRRHLASRVDQLRRRLAGHALPPSSSPIQAIDRLENEVSGRESRREDPDRRAVDRLEAALASTTQGVLVVDEQGRIVFQNRFAASFIEGRHGEAVVADTIHHLIATALSGNDAEQEVHLYGPPGRTLLLAATMTSGDNGLRGAVVFVDDVTERERMDATRRDFVANVSHELRTPIGAMSLLAETLADADDPDISRDLVERIQAEAARLARTIDDLLELSRIEHGTDQDVQQVVVQDVVGEAVGAVQSAADQKGVEIGVVVPDQPLLVEGDQRQLRSAIYNLVDNALKYTEADDGAISVRARQLDEVIQLEVQDNGIGIPRHDLDRVFERFYRVDKARRRTKGGTGLGLSIVSHVVANHGGRVTLDSTEGEGSTFAVMLPAAGDQPTTEAPRPDEVNR